jgi:hypothetical protein
MRACSDRGTSRVVRGSTLTAAGDEIGSTRGFHGGCPADGMKSEADGLTGFGVKSDLINIGVTSVGHRRNLLAAIAALGTEGPTAPSRDAPRLPGARS